jgi:predicted MFS family arabinose efflux permease
MSKEEKKDPFDGDYIGNIWGWKFSLFGLALMLIMVAIMAYRWRQLDIPQEDRWIFPDEQVDSLKTE